VYLKGRGGPGSHHATIGAFFPGVAGWRAGPRRMVGHAGEPIRVGVWSGGVDPLLHFLRQVEAKAGGVWRLASDCQMPILEQCDLVKRAEISV
jgi:hypothetical protein